MTKPDVLALGAGGEDVADLDFVARHHDPVDEQLDKLPLPIEGGGLQSGRDSLAERFQRGRQPERLVEPVGLAAEPPLLALPSGGHVPTSTAELVTQYKSWFSFLETLD
jgi:hypothetical protein